jgi:hypothetical protein
VESSSQKQDALSNDTCPHCGAGELFIREQIASNGVMHLRQECRACRRYIRFLSQGRPIEVMPFGKHKGMAIMDLPHDYLNFLLENVELKGSFLRSLEAEFERRGVAAR